MISGGIKINWFAPIHLILEAKLADNYLRVLAHITKPPSFLTYHNVGQFQNGVAVVYIRNHPINPASKPNLLIGI